MNLTAVTAFAILGDPLTSGSIGSRYVLRSFRLRPHPAVSGTERDKATLSDSEGWPLRRQ